MQYERGSFSVASPGTRQYRDNWDRIFAKQTPSATDETSASPGGKQSIKGPVGKRSPRADRR